MREDEERDEILATLPKGIKLGEKPSGDPNAWAFLDEIGRLCIIPKSGGWIGIDMIATIQADLAPFSD